MPLGSALGPLPQSSGTWEHTPGVTSGVTADAAEPVSQGRPREAPAPIPSRPPPAQARAGTGIPGPGSRAAELP